MQWNDIEERWNKGNALLFTRDSACLQELLARIREQKHRTLVLWALACAGESVRILKERYPEDTRPETAVRLCRDWSGGIVKMPVAKKALLQVHTAAKGCTNAADIARYHAIGQACATVHVETHAIGLPIYELTAVVRERGIASFEEAVNQRLHCYIHTLAQCAAEIESGPSRSWAQFLLDDSRPNKERLLFEKQLQSAALSP